MNDNYFVVDIETFPVDFEAYEKLDEEGKLKLLNPIDSRIVALGIRHNGTNQTFMSENEKEILEKFWAAWRFVKAGKKAVGFSITNFDLPFLVARSLLNNVIISPFVLKEVIDLRDKINAYRHGKTRGKLKEYAKLLGLPVLDVDGSDVAGLWKGKQYSRIKDYLENDLLITDELYKKCKELKILDIERW